MVEALARCADGHGGCHAMGARSRRAAHTSVHQLTRAIKVLTQIRQRLERRRAPPPGPSRDEGRHMADRPYYDLTDAEAQSIADLLNAIHEQRLAEFAGLLSASGVPLEAFDGSLESLDDAWEWALGEVRADFPHVPRNARSSNQLAFGLEWSDPVAPYVSELITQYVLAVVQRYRSDARWVPHPHPKFSAYHMPRIATSRGEVEISSGEYTGALRDIADPARAAKMYLGPDKLRRRVATFIGEHERDRSGVGESILTPLLGRRFEPVTIPIVSSTSATWPPKPRQSDAGAEAAGSDEDGRWAEDYELARDAPEEAWKARPLNERVVAEWMTARRFRTSDGAAVTAALLRTSNPSDVHGTIREYVHLDSDSQIIALSWRGRLRGLGVELVSPDVAVRRQLLPELTALAGRLRGATLQGPM